MIILNKKRKYDIITLNYKELLIMTNFEKQCLELLKDDEIMGLNILRTNYQNYQKS